MAVGVGEGATVAVAVGAGPHHTHTRSICEPSITSSFFSSWCSARISSMSMSLMAFFNATVVLRHAQQRRHTHTHTHTHTHRHIHTTYSKADHSAAQDGTARHM